MTRDREGPTAQRASPPAVPAPGASRHTPTPWVCGLAITGERGADMLVQTSGMMRGQWEFIGRAREGEGNADLVAIVPCGDGYQSILSAKADAAFIIRAVNAFDDMLAALKASIEAASHIDEPGGWHRVRDARKLTLAAIANAEAAP